MNGKFIYKKLKPTIFYCMGNETCSVQIGQNQNQTSLRVKAQENQDKFQITQQNQNLEEQLQQFDNPSHLSNDHSFLKTNYTASNNRMLIPEKVKHSFEIKPVNVFFQLMRYKTPSLCNLQSMDFSLENKKTDLKQKLIHNANQDQDKQVPDKPMTLTGRERRMSLEYALQIKQINQSKKCGTETTQQSVLRQVSSFILTERNLFAPKKIIKSIFVKNRFQPILNQYNFISKVGQGSYGNVYKALHKQNNQLRAVKVLKKSSLPKHYQEKTINQIQILKKLDHPNILKIFEIYYDTKCVSIVTEFCQGGSLYKVVKNNRLSIKTIKIIFRKLMTALAYLHTENIIHRDIKLDNIVLVSKYDQKNEQSIDIRLIDFGLSKFTTVKRFKDKQKIGTCTHMAPQVIDGFYSTKSDIWSAGILLCYLTLGFNPFKGATKEITFDKIQGQELRFAKGLWEKVDIELKDLMIKMLDKKIGNRISAAEVLNHPWLQFEQKLEQTNLMLEKVAKKLYDYYRGNNLVTIVQSYIAYTTTSQSQINQYSWIFSNLDKDHDGQISIEQLQCAFKNSSISFEKKQIEYILQKVKEQHYGKINFTEFVSILSDREKIFAKKALIQAFYYLDVDNSGYIDKKQLQQILNTTQSQLTCIIKQIDSNEDLKISKDEFVKYLQDGNFY